VLALDNDPLSLETARANAAVNGVEIVVRRHDLRHDEAPAAALVLANLLAPLLEAWAVRLRRSPEFVPGAVIASGMLEAEADEVVRAFAPVGLREERRTGSGQWAALLLRR
jgi:ribosomal protein L11 methylase PrmA